MLMQDDTVLEVDRVSKLYSRSPGENNDRMSRILWDTLRGRVSSVEQTLPREFWALKDISFSVKRGEAIGVIGFNGAGKTTLLRLLMGQIPPDSGEIRIAGSSAAMIDLSAGFQTNASGRENIYLRSAMLGRNRAEVERNMDAIIEFTELGDAIDAPLHTYSSGMNMRLAFATTVFVDPDLLIIDEVLSVGDFRFRQKCLERIREMRTRSAFVLVSHSMNDIQRFCEQAIVLKRGAIAFKGDSKEAVAFYQSMRDEAAKKTGPNISHLGTFIEKGHAIEGVEAAWLDGAGQPVKKLESGGELSLRVRFTVRHVPNRLIIGVPLFSAGGHFVTALSSEQSGYDIRVTPGERCEVTIKVPRMPLVPNVYSAVLAIVDGPEYLYRHRISDLSIVPGRQTKFWGDFVLDQSWSVR